MRKAFRVLVEQEPFGRPYENKMSLTGIKLDGTDYIQLAEERDSSRFVMNMVMNILEHLGEFLD